MLQFPPLPPTLSRHSRRVYVAGRTDLVNYLARTMPGATVASVTTDTLAAWVSDMGIRGLSASTIRSYLSAVGASLGRHLTDPISRPSGTGDTTTPLTREQLRALLLAIPHQEANAAQTYAIAGLVLLTGWIAERVIGLCWGDFVVRRTAVTLREGPELPRSVWNCIVASATAAYGSTAIPADFPVFVAVRGFAGRARRETMRNPLSVQEINRRLSRYATMAGLTLPRLTTRQLIATARAMPPADIAHLLDLGLDAPATGKRRLWRRR